MQKALDVVSQALTDDDCSDCSDGSAWNLAAEL